VQILNRNNRVREEAAHLQEKTEMQRLADKTSLRYKNLLDAPVTPSS
jgi:hypothetical protein